MKRLPDDALRRHKGVSFVGITTRFFGHDGQGKFCLMRRSKNSRDEQGRWAIGGGALDWGVGVLDNVLREIQEEYGAKPLKLDFLGYRDVFRKLDDGTPTHWLALDYLALVDPAKVRINEPDKFDEMGWFDPDNLPQPLHSVDGDNFKFYAPQLAEVTQR